MGISPRVPLTTSRADIGYALNKTIDESVKQNFKMLLLTNNGEKTFDSKFGVGLKKYLFTQFSPTVEGEIISAINYQVSRYMPFLKIKNIKFNRDEDNNRLGLQIYYYIEGLQATDILDIIVS